MLEDEEPRGRDRRSITHRSVLAVPSVAREGRLGALLGVNVDVAQAEAARDAGRILGGAALVLSGLFCCGAVVLFSSAALAVFLRDAWRLSWPLALLVVAGVHLVLAVALLLLGRRRLSRPLLKETRALKAPGALAQGRRMMDVE